MNDPVRTPTRHGVPVGGAGPDRPDIELVPRPDAGRVFTARRRVRWGDTDPSGRLRLDAAARMLQDVANDDTRDAGLDPSEPWVVRRTAMRLHTAPATGEMVELATWSGGHGRRWAERRTTITGDDGGLVESAALWVRLDPKTSMPARLDARFHEIYDEAAGGRTVGSRLRLPGPPEVADGLERRRWPLRSTDLDGLGHVNNAATWEPIVDEAVRRGLRPRYAELEYGAGIDPDDEVELMSERGDGPTGGTLDVWLVVDGMVRATAHLHDSV